MRGNHDYRKYITVFVGLVFVLFGLWVIRGMVPAAPPPQPAMVASAAAPAPVVSPGMVCNVPNPASNWTPYPAPASSASWDEAPAVEIPAPGENGCSVMINVVTEALGTFDMRCKTPYGDLKEIDFMDKVSCIGFQFRSKGEARTIPYRFTPKR